MAQDIPLDERDRLLVIGNAEHTRAWRELIARDYAELTVCACETYLSGIAEVSRLPVRAALAEVDPLLVHLDDAVQGLRQALGHAAKLILCCTPDGEPTARRLVRDAADEYLVLPLSRRDLDRAIDYARPEVWPAPSSAPVASMKELEALGALLSEIGGRPAELLEHIAELVRQSVNARGATIIVQGSVATSGDVVVDPVLAAPLTGDAGVIGQLTLGACADGAYSPDDAEKLRCLASVTSRILETASAQHHLRRLAETDECSGLPNRRYLYRHLDAILDRARRDRFPVTVLTFDIDNFKKYNDELGHDAGDRIIRTVGDVFRRLCRAQDIVARMGGDEFAVVFWDSDGPRAPGSEHPDSPLTVLDRVRDALKRERLGEPASTTSGGRSSIQDAPSLELSLTISGGLATFPWDASTREELLRRADQALLSAKRAGKNRVYLIGNPGVRQGN